MISSRVFLLTEIKTHQNVNLRFAAERFEASFHKLGIDLEGTTGEQNQQMIGWLLL